LENLIGYNPILIKFMFKDFKQFILRGNVVDLAVAVVIGASFGAVINSLVKDILFPLLGAIVKAPNFETWIVTVNGSRIAYGNFINTVFSFLLLAAGIFFLVVMPINALVSRSKRGKPLDPTTKKCPQCLSEVPIDAKRCAFCTEPII
jgi:large conductance mechanosensitive channel